jgi:hypothetical protein
MSFVQTLFPTAAARLATEAEIVDAVWAASVELFQIQQQILVSKI